jgi:hypothetical protein
LRVLLVAVEPSSADEMSMPPSESLLSMAEGGGCRVEQGRSFGRV